MNHRKTKVSALSTQDSALSTAEQRSTRHSALVIAIDGPSGSGKSTVGKAVARRLNYLYIDSGAVYRAIGRKAIDTGTPLENAELVAELARESDIKLIGDPDHLRVLLDGRDVTDAIRLSDASRASSIVATIPEVREAVVAKLREMAREGGVVMDGRDIGTKVFPDAQIKVFLEATLGERARRRFVEESARGRDVPMEMTKAELEERDRRDRERAATPLVRAEDAVLVETSHMSLDQVIEHVLEIVKTRS